MRTSMHQSFNGIAKKYFEAYKQAKLDYDELTFGNQQWDILSHSPAENGQYFSAYAMKQEFAIISTVFLVMSLEGLINEYGQVSLNDDSFSKIEKKGLEDKLEYFYKECTRKPFPKDTQLYEQIHDIVSVRNNLVHNKSQEIDLATLTRDDVASQEIYFGYVNSLIGNSKKKYTKQKLIYDVLEKSHSVYEKLMELLATGNDKVE